MLLLNSFNYEVVEYKYKLNCIKLNQCYYYLYSNMKPSINIFYLLKYYWNKCTWSTKIMLHTINYNNIMIYFITNGINKQLKLIINKIW